MSLTNDELLTILKLIEESEYDDVRLEIGDIKLHVQKQGVSAGSTGTLPVDGEKSVPNAAAVPSPPPRAAAPQPSTLPDAVAVEAVPEGLLALRAPMLGTFYRAPAPGEKPFVEVGATVEATDTVCLVEVMKLFNSVKAGVAGTVVRILVENGAMVEYGQILMLIEPEKA